MRKRVLIVIIIIVLVIVALWLGGVIPKQIGKICGIKYMSDNFPKMELEYVDIEWNKYYGDYIISFRDNKNEIYSCVISPKYFPINLGQGVNSIIEKYNSNNTAPYIPEGMDIANEDKNKAFANEKEYNRDPNNVTIEVLKDTITNKSLEILIIDNNKEHYGWGVEFRVQEKKNGVWQDLKYLSNDLSWTSIAYELGEDNQLTQKLNIEEYYGELSKGVYRIIKPVYDKVYIDIYSNEFEIK